MSDPEKKICRYFNTLGGCWYGDSCKFLHIPNKKPPCKFYGSSTGCRYGESCHFSHDRAPFKSVENYNNPSVELIKEVFKENVDPSELSGTNNNNMTQPMTTLLNNSAGQPGLNNTTDNSNSKDVKAINPEDDATMNLPIDLTAVATSSTMEQAERSATTQSDYQTTLTDVTQGGELESTVCTEALVNMPGQTVGEYTHADGKGTHELAYRDLSEGQLTMAEDGQNYAAAAPNGRANGMVTNDMEIFCGSCKRMVERRGNESYCTLLKDHYLECFLDKEGDHVKYVKTKAALEPGQMYWCKSCILIFEKPWSLFQHMADKAKGCKVQRWEKKIHLDWMDNVAGLMAGYDLGLFSPAKLRIDLRNLLADQHTMEEEMEVAAVTAAAMMQWLTPLSNPWRLQQREMMRKIEQLNRQMLRKANIGLNASYPMRAALTASAATVPPAAASPAPSVNYNRGVSQSVTPAPQRYTESSSYVEMIPEETQSVQLANTTNEVCEVEVKDDDKKTESEQNSTTVGPLGDSGIPSSTTDTSSTPSETTGAAGDNMTSQNRPRTPASVRDSKTPECVDSNNTNSAQIRPSFRNEETSRRLDYKRGYHSAPTYGYGKSHIMGMGPHYRGFNDSSRYQVHPRGSRTPSYGQFNGGGHRLALHRPNRVILNNTNAPPTRGANAFNPPSFHASMDFNCGFTDDEVEELLSQGINPWDSEAPAALAVLRGELDHLLD